MIYLLLNIVLSSTFILSFRWLQRRRDDILTIGAINYIVAGFFAAALFFGGNQSNYGMVSCLTGAVNGATYFIAFFFLLMTMAWKGAAIAAVLSRLSILLAIVGGILFWRERPSLWQSLGIGLGCISLTLIGTRGSSMVVRETPWYVPLVCLVFFLTAGCSRLAQEAFKHEAHPAEQPAYLLAGFGLAGAASIVMMIIRRKRPTISAVVIGTFVGLANVLQTWYVLKALESLDGFIVFPIASAGGLLLTTLIAVTFLEERLTRMNYTGIAMAVLSLALLHGATWNH